MHKLTDLQSLIYSSQYKLVGITETWLSKDIFDNEILPYDFTIYRNDRGSRGGGVLVAINSSIPSKLLDSPPDLELIVVEANCGSSSPLIICCVYLPPNCPEITLSNTLLHLSKFTNNNPVLILGDFNFPDINWSTLTGHSTNSNSFCDFTFDNSLSQLVSHATHNKGNILDLVLSNVPELFANCAVQQSSILLTDHYIISLQTHLFQNSTKDSSISESSYVLDFSKLDAAAMNSYLLDYDFTHCFSYTELDDVWYEIKAAITTAIQMFTPRVKLRSNSHPKWFTSETRHQLNCVHTLRKKAKKHPTPHNSSKLEEAESQLADHMRVAKSNYESKLVSDYAHRSNYKIYRYINGLLKRDMMPPIMHYDSSTASADCTKANLFNMFFGSIYTKPTTDFALAADVPESTLML